MIKENPIAFLTVLTVSLNIKGWTVDFSWTNPKITGGSPSSHTADPDEILLALIPSS